MKYLCALITVSDINQARYFYENLLKQEVETDFGENVGFKGGFSIHLETHYKNLINKEIKQGGNNFELYFEDDDLDQLVNTLKANSVEFVHELREQPWCQKVVRFYDPDKYIIEIGETMKHLVQRLKKTGLEAEQIAKATSLPIDYVNILSNE
ncbi:MAG TPA: VOC family protein [Paludibacter sp.]|nr:VOC family protein [Paludibacter sp.]